MSTRKPAPKKPRPPAVTVERQLRLQLLAAQVHSLEAAARYDEARACLTYEELKSEQAEREHRAVEARRRAMFLRTAHSLFERGGERLLNTLPKAPGEDFDLASLVPVLGALLGMSFGKRAQADAADAQPAPEAAAPPAP